MTEKVQATKAAQRAHKYDDAMTRALRFSSCVSHEQSNAKSDKYFLKRKVICIIFGTEAYKALSS